MFLCNSNSENCDWIKVTPFFLTTPYSDTALTTLTKSGMRLRTTGMALHYLSSEKL